MRSSPASRGDVFELRITLCDIQPAIWRRVCIPADATLGVLHEVLQAAFGWKNAHLHDFFVGDARFGMVDEEDEILSVNEHAAPLGAVTGVGRRFLYRYDYGDNWKHEVTVERMTDDGDERIVCTGGARACPPEDCGGTSGYEQLLEILANPRDEGYAEMKLWVGRRFDPEKFDVAAVNKRLAAISKRLGRHGK